MSVHGVRGWLELLVVIAGAFGVLVVWAGLCLLLADRVRRARRRRRRGGDINVRPIGRAHESGLGRRQAGR